MVVQLGFLFGLLLLYDVFIGSDAFHLLLTGISYLSRAQESAAKVQTGNALLHSCSLESTSAFSVADSIFTERIKTRVKNWMKDNKNPHDTNSEGEQ